MNVKLLTYEENVVKKITDIASICYGRDEAKNPDKLLKTLFNLNHLSVFEHVNYTWKVKGISRTALAQLTRHRHMSFTVRSSRYTDESKQEMIIPDSILWDDVAMREWVELRNKAREVYKRLRKRGIKREDSRFVLPQALSTDLYITCNLRALIHLNNVRNTNHAQWEIRKLTQEMVKLVIKVNPEIKFMFS